MIPLLSSARKAGAAVAAQHKQKQVQKEKSMTANTRYTGPPTPRERHDMKPTHMAMASASLPNPSKPQKAVPSQVAIAEKAYEIWLSLGQVTGRDQQNWFEAEQQLRQV